MTLTRRRRNRILLLRALHRLRPPVREAVVRRGLAVRQALGPEFLFLPFVEPSLKTVRHSLLLLLFSSLTGAAWVAHRPALWPALQELDATKKPALGVVDQLSQAAIKRSAPFEITEARLNQHLASQLKTRPRWAAASSWWRLEAPQFDLQEDLAVLRLRWHLADRHSCDLTVHLKLGQEAGQFRIEVVEGAYGRLRVPRGLLHPAKAVLAELAEVLRPEVEALFAMNQVIIAEDKLLIDPRFADSSAQASVFIR